MPRSFQNLRRQITQSAIEKAISLTAALPLDRQCSAVRRLVLLVTLIPAVRHRVRRNMRLALGEKVPARAEFRFFEHVGWYLSNALATFHRGIGATHVISQVSYDESITILDNAFAEGRGVVLTAAHWSGHELIAAVIARRYPMVMLVRQTRRPERAARKVKWYKALGVETVLRPLRPSSLADAAVYLRVLKRGKVFAITPDLITDSNAGVEVRLFDRLTRIHGGAFAIAIAAGAPMIRVSGEWQPDSKFLVKFERAPSPLKTTDRENAVKASVQDWCYWFEDRVRSHPENWLFWLDKRWSRFLRHVPRAMRVE